MSHIVVDAAAAVQLKAASCPVEIRDPNGKILGRFSPAIDWSEYEIVGPEISDEELERRSKSDEPCFTTAEVLEYLRKL